MRQIVQLLLSLSCLGLVVASSCGVKAINDKEVDEFLKTFDAAALKWFHEFALRQWDLETNITEYNEELFVIQETLTAKFLYDMREAALKFNSSVTTPDNQRQLGKIKNIGAAAQPNSSRFAELSQLRADMEHTYVTAKVCLTPNECLQEPNISRIMQTSRDYDRLLALWVGWRNETGRKIRKQFSKFVELSNENVRISGYKDTGEQWRSLYESATLQDDVNALYEQVRPLYEQLHAYVRRRLKKVYGESRFPSSGHIPAHILGNMWSQQWDSIYDLVTPFENKNTLDVTAEMKRQNYTVHKMFRTAEDFFLSLGFEGMTPTFWNRSVFERPSDGRDFLCLGSSWQFYDQGDFRIKTCAGITQYDLVYAHRYLAHIEYYMSYKDQPFIYREGANAAFHQAVSNFISISVETPEHMKMLGLVNDTFTDNETEINFLMKAALLNVAFPPFGIMIDKFRWSVFSGETTPDNYTKQELSLRCALQGVSPPVPRSEVDFDAGAKYHVPANVPYLQYFLSFIMQFQFHEAACKAANHEGPLHRCDIYNSKAAGDKLREVLNLGSSKPWPQAMKLLTGQEKMDAGPLLEYFQPLMDFLRKENGNDYGWDPACPNGSLSQEN